MSKETEPPIDKSEETVTFTILQPREEGGEWFAKFKYSWPELVGVGRTESDAMRDLLNKVDAA